MQYQRGRKCNFLECPSASEINMLSVRCCPAALESIRTNFRDVRSHPVEFKKMSVGPGRNSPNDHPGIIFWRTDIQGEGARGRGKGRYARAMSKGTVTNWAVSAPRTSRGSEPDGGTIGIEPAFAHVTINHCEVLKQVCSKRSLDNFLAE